MAITGKVKVPTIIKSEVNYRKLQALNYSMLKTWDENPSLFFEQFKLGRPRKSKSSQSSIVGDIAHFYILDCNGSDTEFEHKLEEKFAQINFNVGAGQVFVLCDHLFDVTEENMNTEGIVTMPLDERFEEAYKRICEVKEKKGGVDVQKYYKGKDIDKVWDDFEKNQDAQEYFKMRIANIGKTIISPIHLDKGKFVAQNILKDDNTSHIFQGRNLHTSFPVEWIYDNKDCSQTSCKSEIDAFKVDDKNKKIYLYDLKTTWDNEGFEYTYLRSYYYIQQAYYYLAAKYHFSHIQEEYSDYEIVPMQFIVADTSLNNRRPLIYPCSELDLNAGLNGFNLAHRKYKGVNELMEEICWAENNNIWNMSKEAHSKKGVISFNFDYQFNEAV